MTEPTIEPTLPPPMPAITDHRHFWPASWDRDDERRDLPLEQCNRIDAVAFENGAYGIFDPLANKFLMRAKNWPEAQEIAQAVSNMSRLRQIAVSIIKDGWQAPW